MTCTNSSPCTGAEDVDADDMEAGEADLEGSELAPQAQVILTGCWLTMKEISLLLGTIASCAPLPGSPPLTFEQQTVPHS